MRIKSKVFLITSIIFICLIFVLTLVSFQIILKSFNELEFEKTEESISLIQRTIENEIENLDSTNGDWAPWDDTYNFVNNNHNTYVESNLGEDTLTNLRIDMMLFYDKKNNLFFNTCESSVNESAKLKCQKIVQYIYDFNLLNNFDNSNGKGLIIVDDMPMLISSQAITKNGGESDIAGRLVMIRFFDNEEKAYIESIIGQEITLYTNLAEIKNSSLLTDKELLRKHSCTFASNNSQLASYLVIDDLFKTKSIILEQFSDRNIYDHGKNSIMFFIISFVILIIFVGLALVLILNKIVLIRILKLSSELNEIEKSEDFSKRVNKNGADEITLVQENINNTLEALELALIKSKAVDKILSERASDFEKLNFIQKGYLPSKEQATNETKSKPKKKISKS